MQKVNAKCGATEIKKAIKGIKFENQGTNILIRYRTPSNKK